MEALCFESFANMQLEWLCVIVFAHATFVIATPHGYGFNGGAAAKAEAGAAAGAISGIGGVPVGLPLGAGFSGSFSKSASTSFASSSASSSSGAFSFSGPGSSGLPDNNRGCATGTCEGSKNENQKFDAYNNGQNSGYDKIGSQNGALAGAATQSGALTGSNSNVSQCVESNCSPKIEQCTGSNCNDAILDKTCKSGKCNLTSLTQASSLNKPNNCAPGQCSTTVESGSNPENTNYYNIDEINTNKCAGGVCILPSKTALTQENNRNTNSDTKIPNGKQFGLHNTNSDKCTSGQCKDLQFDIKFTNPSIEDIQVIIDSKANSKLMSDDFQAKDYGKDNTQIKPTFNTVGTSNCSSPNCSDKINNSYEAAFGTITASDYIKPVTYLTTPKHGPPCTSPSCSTNNFPSAQLTTNSYVYPVTQSIPPTDSKSLNCTDDNCSGQPNFHFTQNVFSPENKCNSSNCESIFQHSSHQSKPTKHVVPIIVKSNKPYSPPTFSNVQRSSDLVPVLSGPNPSGLTHTRPSTVESFQSEPSYLSNPSSKPNNEYRAPYHAHIPAYVPITPARSPSEKMYTGGFGGPPGILKPNDFNIPHQPNTNYKPPIHGFDSIPCSTGNCNYNPTGDRSPLRSYNKSPTSHQNNNNAPSPNGKPLSQTYFIESEVPETLPNHKPLSYSNLSFSNPQSGISASKVYTPGVTSPAPSSPTPIQSESSTPLPLPASTLPLGHSPSGSKHSSNRLTKFTHEYIAENNDDIPVFISLNPGSVSSPNNPTYSLQITNKSINEKNEKPYTGGFGGPPGILKPNDSHAPDFLNNNNSKFPVQGLKVPCSIGNCNLNSSGNNSPLGSYNSSLTYSQKNNNAPLPNGKTLAQGNPTTPVEPITDISKKPSLNFFPPKFSSSTPTETPLKGFAQKLSLQVPFTPRPVPSGSSPPTPFLTNYFHSVTSSSESSMIAPIPTGSLRPKPSYLLNQSTKPNHEDNAPNTDELSVFVPVLPSNLIQCRGNGCSVIPELVSSPPSLKIPNKPVNLKPNRFNTPNLVLTNNKSLVVENSVLCTNSVCNHSLTDHKIPSGPNNNQSLMGPQMKNNEPLLSLNGNPLSESNPTKPESPITVLPSNIINNQTSSSSELLLKLSPSKLSQPAPFPFISFPSGSSPSDTSSIDQLNEPTHEFKTAGFNPISNTSCKNSGCSEKTGLVSLPASADNPLQILNKSIVNKIEKPYTGGFGGPPGILNPNDDSVHTLLNNNSHKSMDHGLSTPCTTANCNYNLTANISPSGSYKLLPPSPQNNDKTPLMGGKSIFEISSKRSDQTITLPSSNPSPFLASYFNNPQEPTPSKFSSSKDFLSDVTSKSSALESGILLPSYSPPSTENPPSTILTSGSHPSDSRNSSSQSIKPTHETKAPTNGLLGFETLNPISSTLCKGSDCYLKSEPLPTSTNYPSQVSNKPTTDKNDKTYTGSFGGPPGILKPNNFKPNVQGNICTFGNCNYSLTDVENSTLSNSSRKDIQNNKFPLPNGKPVTQSNLTRPSVPIEGPSYMPSLNLPSTSYIPEGPASPGHLSFHTIPSRLPSPGSSSTRPSQPSLFEHISSGPILLGQSFSLNQNYKAINNNDASLFNSLNITNSTSCIGNDCSGKHELLSSPTFPNSQSQIFNTPIPQFNDMSNKGGFGAPLGILKVNDMNTPNIPNYNNKSPVQGFNSKLCTTGNCNFSPNDDRSTSETYNNSPTGPSSIPCSSGNCNNGYNSYENHPASYNTKPCTSGYCASVNIDFVPERKSTSQGNSVICSSGNDCTVKPGLFSLPTSPKYPTQGINKPNPNNNEKPYTGGFGAPPGILSPNSFNMPNVPNSNNKPAGQGFNSLLCITGSCNVGQNGNKIPTATFNSSPIDVQNAQVQNNNPSSQSYGSVPCTTGYCNYGQNDSPTTYEHNKAPCSTGDCGHQNVPALNTKQSTQDYNPASCVSGNCKYDLNGNNKNPNTALFSEAPCTTGNCGSQKVNTDLSLSSGAYATSGAFAKAGVYTGGFGGPPGLLKPYDNGKIEKSISSDFDGKYSNAQHSVSHTINPNGAHSTYNAAGSSAGAFATAGASAGAFGGATHPSGHYNLNAVGSHKAGSGCGSGCDSSSNSNGGTLNFDHNAGLSPIGPANGLREPKAGAINTANSGTGAFGFGGSFASSAAHASAGAFVKGYGRR